MADKKRVVIDLIDTCDEENEPVLNSLSAHVNTEFKRKKVDRNLKSLQKNMLAPAPAPSSSIVANILKASSEKDWLAVLNLCDSLNNGTKLVLTVSSLISVPLSIAMLYILAYMNLDEDVSGVIAVVKCGSYEIDSMEQFVSSYVLATYCDKQSNEDALIHANSLLRNDAVVAHVGDKWKGEMKALCEKYDEMAAKKYANIDMIMEMVPKKLVGSAAQTLWQQMKSKNVNVTSDSLDILMKMTGLEQVKSWFVNQYNQIRVAKMRGGDVISNYNCRFDGNPGTGKTTVARLYADFLIEAEIIPETALIEETSGSNLKSNGVSGLEDLLDSCLESNGGVIFVDEAYQLLEMSGMSQILDLILVHSERLKGKYGPIVWIFAGYAKKMDKLFEMNDGLLSRFPNKVIFEDYTYDELLSIFNGLLERGGKDIKDLQDDKKNQSNNATNTATTATSTAATATAANIYTYPGVGTNNNNNNNNAKNNGRGKKYASKKVATPAGVGGGGVVMGNPYYPAGYNYYAQQQQQATQQQQQTDQWGNIWKYDATRYTWIDPYGNISGYGVNNNLGTQSNPIVSKQGTYWIKDTARNIFVNMHNPLVTSSEYPGKPPAAPLIVEIKSFQVSKAKWARIAMKRLSRLSNCTGFGNARAVRNVFDAALKRQAARLGKSIDIESEDPYLLIGPDLIGPKPTRESLMECLALKELSQMYGLKAVKAEVDKLVENAIQNAQREEDEVELLPVSLNRVFVGNPGTGKTTVAKLYAKILAHLGLLSKGEVVFKFASDFTGSVLGSSEMITKGILESAKGCVLVIDEAYGLNPVKGVGAAVDIYRESVINTIVEMIQGVPGEDRAVILLGYKDEMEQLMMNANPGLARRFQFDQCFEFEDYDDNALCMILKDKVRAKGLKISLDVARYAVTKLAKARAMPNFGNAGAVNNLLSDAMLRMQIRQKNDKLVAYDTLVEADFHDGKEEVSEEKLFNELVGMDSVKQTIHELKCTIELALKQGKDPKSQCGFNYIFTGSPGTGKTTVARLMGKIFQKYGLIPSDEVVETSASDLMTGFVGQAGKQTKEVFKKARGKVLFIDEAYQLNPKIGGGYMQEVLDEIVKLLTHEDYKGKMMVILAGYPNEMDEMLNGNPGLRSRFPDRIHFDDFTIELSVSLLKNRIKANDFKIIDGMDSHLKQILTQLKQAPCFANGRDIVTLSDKIFREVAIRNKEVISSGSIISIDKSILDSALNKLLLTKSSLASNTSVSIGHQQNDANNNVQYATSNITSTHIKIDHKMAKEIKETVEQSPEVEQQQKTSVTAEPYLVALQTILDQLGLNSESGINTLTSLSMNDTQVQNIINQLSTMLNISTDIATNKILQWRIHHEGVREDLRKQKEEEAKAKKEKRQALVPIWRCAVCGRADMPYIACYVQPYIVRYDKVSI